MRKGLAFGFWLLAFGFLPVEAQRLLTLDSCRAMALRNNKQISVSKVKEGIAVNLRKSARTKYLPHVSALGSYEHTSREVSILNDGQKTSLGTLGTTAVSAIEPGMTSLTENLGSLGAMMAQQGLPTENFQQMSGELQQQMGQSTQQLEMGLNQEGQRIIDAFRTDTRNIWAGSILLTQPLFMGGAIVAANRIADINEQMMKHSTDAREQSTLYQTDQIYWQVVSLKHKQKLAQAYLDVVKKLDDDVHKMIDEGVATKSDGLTVDVKLNEAEMALMRVNDGVTLSKMLLCQTIGLPVNEKVTLADENAENIAVVTLTTKPEVKYAMSFRPELRLLSDIIEMSRQTTNVLKAGNLPQVALTGGYAVSNPNVLNGFEKKFGGFWHVGVLMRVPIWNWGDVKYKVRASKGATAIASLEYNEAREKIELQVSQMTYKVDEANKRLALAQSSVRRADENLRMANVGFQEGVITPTTVMEAQTAWLQAQTQKIDAEIEVRLSQVELQKSLGLLQATPEKSVWPKDAK